MSATLVSKPGCVLSDADIVQHRKNGTVVIEPFSEQQLSTSSYDVTLGESYFRERTYPVSVNPFTNRPQPSNKTKFFNPYSESDVKRVWGEPQTALTMAQQSHPNVLENIDYYKDKVIFIEPGETILAHTNEFIGGKDNITTMMKARSSMGRNFIEVCKCFPPETRLLTNRGFVFVQDITMTDVIAAYNPASASIEYQKPSRIIMQKGKHQMVCVKQQHDTVEDNQFLDDTVSNHIELSTTEDHDWYIQANKSCCHSLCCCCCSSTSYSKVAARSLMYKEEEESSSFRVLTSVTNGLSSGVTFPYKDELGFKCDAEVNAFLEFIGYWLLSNAEYRYSKEVDSLPETHRRWAKGLHIQAILQRAGLQSQVDYHKHLDCAIVTNSRWCEFFFKHCTQNYAGHEKLTTLKKPSALSELKSISSPLVNPLPLVVPDWIFTLKKENLRSIISGIIVADGRATSKDVIFTSDVSIRDQLLHLLILAGYSPYFKPARRMEKDGWQIFITYQGDCVIEPQRDVSKKEYNGTVHCLTVPNGLVLAQTAKVENGVVTQCSKTMVIGQCAGWGDVGYCNRWTMELTNNSRFHTIPLVVGRRIAQIVFFFTGPTKSSLTGIPSDYCTTGKYQTTSDFVELQKTWSAASCIPKLYLDRECKPKVAIAIASDAKTDSAVKNTTQATDTDT